jgi:hypothetical protein
LDLGSGLVLLLGYGIRGMVWDVVVVLGFGVGIRNVGSGLG